MMTNAEWNELSDEAMAPYFAGEKLFGDDFTPKDLEQWFADEKEACADMGYKDRARDQYAYHAINDLLGFRHLPSERRFHHMLGLGSAYGPELQPLLPRVDRITIVEASDQLSQPSTERPGVEYLAARPDGRLDLEDGACDLAVCLGVLHHIANVSFVLREVGRCMAPNGWFCLREPIVSMQDWRNPRPGLTRRERGIPQHLLEQFLEEASFEFHKASPCMHPGALVLSALLTRATGAYFYNQRWGVHLDRLICTMIPGSGKYHATTWWDRLRPTSVFYVCRKRSGNTIPTTDQ